MKTSDSAYPTMFKRMAVRVTAIYLVAGGAWILFSDHLLNILGLTQSVLQELQTLKGWGFVVMTAVLLYLLLMKYLKEIEREVHLRGESEERYRSVFDSVPISIWDLDLSRVKADLDHLKRQKVTELENYFSVNPTFVAQTLGGIGVNSINRKTLELFAAPSVSALTENLGKRLDAEILAVAATALIAISTGKGRFEAETSITNLRGDGKSVIVSLTIPEDADRYKNVPVCVTDITDRKRTEEMLQLFELAIEQINEGISITTADLEHPGPVIVYANRAFAKMTGYGQEELIGLTPRILQGPKTDRSVMDRLRMSLWQRQTFYGQAVNYRKDGSEFLMEWYIVPLVNKKFQVTHFVAVHRDISGAGRKEKG